MKIHRFGLLSLVLVFLVSCSDSTSPELNVAAADDLVACLNPSCSQSVVLDGAVIEQTSFGIRYKGSARIVKFVVDGSSYIERYAPFDAYGTDDSDDSSNFKSHAEGSHTASAEVNGEIYKATFTVGEGGTPPPPPTSGEYALRGNPNFSEGQLSAEQRKWYERMWGAISNDEQAAGGYRNFTEVAKSNDSYQYRGNLYRYNNALLTAFRITGDLRLLDEVSRISELMKAELADAWLADAVLMNDERRRDGFLNWVLKYATADDIYGKDTAWIHDSKAHTNVAQFAWAFENNRDLRSPGGYDYAKQADFWKDYLVNHYEAKWRKRQRKPSGFPFKEHNGTHTYHSMLVWHYYMGKLTGDRNYTAEAKRLANRFWDVTAKETSSRYGPALVWGRRILSDDNYAHPQHYARNIVQESIDLHFEGFAQYADESTIQKMSRSVADFVIKDPVRLKFSRDISGGVRRASIPASDASRWDDMNENRYNISPWAYLSAWDVPDGRITKTSENVYKDLYGISSTPEGIQMPVALFLKESLK